MHAGDAEVPHGAHVATSGRRGVHGARASSGALPLLPARAPREGRGACARACTQAHAAARPAAPRPAPPRPSPPRRAAAARREQPPLLLGSAA